MKLKLKQFLPCCLVATSTLPLFATSCAPQTSQRLIVEDWWRLNYVYKVDASVKRESAPFQFNLENFAGEESVDITLINQKDEKGVEGNYVEIVNGAHFDVTDQTTHTCEIKLTSDEHYVTGKEYSFVAKAIIKDKAGNTIESLTDTLYIEVAKPTLPEYFETNGEGKIVGFDSKYDAEIAKCSLLAIPQTIKHEDNTDETITSIADNAFHDVGGARYENIKYLLLDSSWGTNPTLTSIGNSAFLKAKFTGECYIPKTVVTIGDHAFDSSTISGLHFDTYDDGHSDLMTIKNWAFNHCEKIASDIIIPEGCAEIGTCAFYYCEKARNVQIPKSVTKINDTAFYYVCWGRRGGTKLTIPQQDSQLTTIAHSAFWCCDVGGDIYIPNQCTTIGYNAFLNCNWVVGVSLPAGLTSLESKAFSDMDRLQKLDLSRIDSTDDILFKVESAQPTFFAATGSISKKIKIKLNSTLKTPEKQAQVKAALIANGMNESYITFEE